MIKYREFQNGSISKYIIRVKGDILKVMILFQYNNHIFKVPLVRSYKEIKENKYIYSIFKFKSISNLKPIKVVKLE